MSDRKWKQGDVAMVRDACEYDGVEPGEKVRIFVRSREAGKMVWWGPDGFLPPESDLIESVRPLVVIDPEDREQVERLAALFRMERVKGDRDAIVGGSTDAMQAALREFADLKPRIEEPTGLGAVVETSLGEKWIRFESCTGSWWRNRDGNDKRWSYLDVARVLNKGWSE